MKKQICLLITAALVLGLFCGCNSGTPKNTAANDPASVVPTPEVTEPPTEPPTEVSTEPPTETPTEPPTETPEPVQTPFPVPYLQDVTQADESIFKGPGYDYDYVGTVEKAGVYTIVAEARDSHDNLWGKLKSGKGWIDLTHVRAMGGEASAMPEDATEPPFSPYLIDIPQADESIYTGPGYDYGYVCTVEKAGIYTIVEESWDNEGNLWGRLKSGIGWVNLTSIENSAQQKPLMTANYADDRLLNSGNYYHFIVDPTEYAVQIAFRAYEDLQNVQLFSTVFTDYGWETSEELVYLAELTPDKALVVDLAFGDTTEYKISFQDSNGHLYIYRIAISGRNDSVLFTAA